MQWKEVTTVVASEAVGAGLSGRWSEDIMLYLDADWVRQVHAFVNTH